ncbi:MULTISPECIES: UV DNA damage repair endonuclease UvsE [Bacillus]|uniref:UV DNA damage repair endonuclease UvsE n=1 Tax=Bacillus TaxID=1386 RepID=UPI0002F1F5A5|nr:MULTISPECIES: UV DNA damage repair endonuclease UvsE [Bacillus]
MIIRFGYVSTAISLYDASPSKTITFKRYSQLSDSDRLDKLKEITRTNINQTLRMLYYNAAHQIELYRMSSSIVPLATHPEVRWDFVSPFREEWQAIGDFVKKEKMRVSFHPNQFTLFTSPRGEVTANAVIDMEFHYKMLEAMGIEDTSYINIHVGGAYGDKDLSLKRFHTNLKQLPHHIKAQMTLENDDKTYNTAETLAVCEQEQVPFVFDYHHHMANLCEESLSVLLPRIFSTWRHTSLCPKVHISSPKSTNAFRAHSDYVDVDFILPFIKELKNYQIDVDVMIEAKKKDQALLQLVDDLSKQRGIKRLSGASIQI